jgi:hypothetical protein
MAEYDMFHVAIAPPDALEASVVERVAAIINKDLYGTRLLLTGKIPRIVSHYQTIQEAEPVIQSLRAIGLVVVACSDSELCRPSSVSFRAYTLKLEVGEVTFWNKAGDIKTMRAEDMFLILKGTMQSHAKTETINTRMKFSVPATLLAGGIPIWRRVKEKPKGLASQTECYLRFYGWTSPEPTVEIHQYDFDYSFLGAKMSTSSLQNLNTTIMELMNIFPQAVFDSRLTEHVGAPAPFIKSVNEVDINCKLIYLYHQAVSGEGPSA